MAGVRIETKFAAAAFIVAVAHVPGIFGSGYVGRWWAVAVLPPLISDCDPRRLPSPVLALLSFGIAWAAASLLWTPIPAEAVLDVFFLAALVIVMAAGASVADLSPALAGFGWGVAVSSAISLMAHIGVPFPAIPVPRSGLFFNTEILAETAAPVAAWAVAKRRYELAVALAPAILLNGSRVAAFAVLVGLVFAWKDASAWKRGACLMAVAVMAVAAMPALGLTKASTAATRIVLWGAAALSITPLGRGIGWWSVAHTAPLEEYAHSDVLQLAVELGPLAAAALIAVPAAILVKGGDDVPERCALIVLCVESLVSFPLHLPATGFLAALLAGHLARGWVGVRVAGLSGGASVLLDVRRARARAGVVVRERAPGAGDVPVREEPSPPGAGGHARVRREDCFT